MGLRAFFEAFPEQFAVAFDLEGPDADESEPGARGEFFVTLLEPPSEDDADTQQEERLIDAKIGQTAAARARASGEPSGARGGGGGGGGAVADDDEQLAPAGSMEQLTVKALQAELRQRGLPATGLKAELIQRLSEAHELTGWTVEAPPSSVAASASASAPAPQATAASAEPDGADRALLECVAGYLGRQPGGAASSRNVGRHLASSQLLVTLKQRYSGLYHFLQAHDEHFRIVIPNRDQEHDAYGGREFNVQLLSSSPIASRP